MESAPLIVSGIVVLIILVGAIKYNSLSSPFRMLLWLLSVMLIGQLGSWSAAIIFHNNLGVMHGLSIACVPFYGLLFESLVRGKRARQILFIVFLLASFGNAYISFIVERFQTFPTLNLHILGMIVVLTSIYCINLMMKSEPEVQVTRQSEFWLVIALFFYHVTTLSIFGVYNYLDDHNMDTSPINSTNFFLSLVFYSLLGYSLILELRKPAGDE